MPVKGGAPGGAASKGGAAKGKAAKGKGGAGGAGGAPGGAKVSERATMASAPRRDMMPDNERMVEWLVQTNPDSIGVLVALHAFETVLQRYNEEYAPDAPWSVVRENNSAGMSFGVLGDIPSHLFDFQTTFKAQVQLRTNADKKK